MKLIGVYLVLWSTLIVLYALVVLLVRWDITCRPFHNDRLIFFVMPVITWSNWVEIVGKNSKITKTYIDHNTSVI